MPCRVKGPAPAVSWRCISMAACGVALPMICISACICAAPASTPAGAGQPAYGVPMSRSMLPAEWPGVREQDHCSNRSCTGMPFHPHLPSVVSAGQLGAPGPVHVLLLPLDGWAHVQLPGHPAQASGTSRLFTCTANVLSPHSRCAGQQKGCRLFNTHLHSMLNMLITGGLSPVDCRWHDNACYYLHKCEGGCRLGFYTSLACRKRANRCFGLCANLGGA